MPKVLLLSPRNTLEGNVGLLRQTKCVVLCYAAEVASPVRSIQNAESSLRCTAIPTLQEIQTFEADPYLYEYDFEEVEEREILILHSSGSTGM